MDESLPEEGYYTLSYYKKRVQYFSCPTRFYAYRLYLLEKLCAFKGKELVLNIGCGVGTTEIEFAERFKRITGIDHNLVPLQMAKAALRKHVSSNLQERCNFINAKAERLPYKKNSFDMVICTDFVEHISPSFLLNILEESYHVLKKDGIFILYTPSADYFLEKCKHAIRRLLGKSTRPFGANRLELLMDALLCRQFSVLEYSLQPSHLMIFQAVERFFMRFSILNRHFGRRICIRAVAQKV